MLWSSLTLVAFLAAPGGIWTGIPSHTASPAGDSAVWDEYGLTATEAADFGRYKAVAYRFRDTTGAYAGWLWLKSTDRTAALEGNTVVTCSGACPDAKALGARLDSGQISHSPGSVLPSYLPRKGLIAGSERYLLGPASLAQFAPALPQGAMAFQFSTEAAMAHYKAAKGDILLAVVSYPTPAMARQQAAEFRKSSGTVVKRSGPLVMVVPAAADAEAASALVAGISYQASVSWDEKPPDPHFATELKDMLRAIGQLILFLVALCVVGGLGVGAVRGVRERFGKSTADGDVIVLHLSSK